MNASRASLLFAAVLAAFIIGPALLPATFPPYPLLKWGDILDLATPVAVLPATWLLFRHAAREPPRTAGTLLFVALAGLWASAQGMHLAANAIGHLVEEGSGDLGVLVHELDEVISHYLWHAALLGLSALVLWRALQGQSGTDVREPNQGLTVVASVIFGVTFFIMVVEGGTGALGLPGGALVAVAGVTVARQSLAHRPAAMMFVVGYTLALLLAAIWAGLHGWQLIQFSEAGLIE